MSEPIKVLHVDDEPIFLMAVQRILQRYQITLESVSDGYEALSKMEHFHPDIVLLDLSMPELDGWEVQKKMQENPALQEIPVIITTSRGLPHDLIYGLHEANVADYLLKPFSPRELFESIKKGLRQTQHVPVAI